MPPLDLNRHRFRVSSDRQTRLAILPKKGRRFREIKSLFRRRWLHSHKSIPTLLAVFSVVHPEEHLDPFYHYREHVQESIDPSWEDDIEELLFHGTTRGCLIGETPDDDSPCNSSKCNLCSILMESFDIDMCGTRGNFNRFGHGIYVTSCSSKADDYTENDRYTEADDSSFQVLLLNRVIIGEPCIVTRNAVHLTEPPPGYHSVIGEPGRDLNYEETVVYENDAIRPAYVLVYEHDD